MGNKKCAKIMYYCFWVSIINLEEICKYVDITKFKKELNKLILHSEREKI